MTWRRSDIHDLWVKCYPSHTMVVWIDGDTGEWVLGVSTDGTDYEAGRFGSFSDATTAADKIAWKEEG